MARMATLKETLEFANKVRELGGGATLHALMPATPEESEACLIAVNLNFNCSVEPSHVEWVGDTGWVMTLEDKEVRDKIASHFRLPKHDNNIYSNSYSVALPERIGLVAEAYDKASETASRIGLALADIAYDQEEYGEKPIEELSARTLRKKINAQLSWDDKENRRDIKNLKKMWPYIEASKQQAYELATVVKDGKIVI